jgi:hypothetical protein
MSPAFVFNNIPASNVGKKILFPFPPGEPPPTRFAPSRLHPRAHPGNLQNWDCRLGCAQEWNLESCNAIRWRGRLPHAGPAFQSFFIVYYIDTLVKCKNKGWSLDAIHRRGAVAPAVQREFHHRGTEVTEVGRKKKGWVDKQGTGYSSRVTGIAFLCVSVPLW